MPDELLYPLKLEPALHVKVWGGRQLSSQLGKPLPTDQPYGESWELHDTSLVTNGAYRGASLGELARQFGAQLIGAGNDPADGMPLLAKFIDAGEWLSVQVHPDDTQAKALEGEPRGKTEAWVLLHAEPGARLVIGLQPGTSKAQISDAIQDNRLEALLVYAEVRPGDLLYIPANTVHALGPGILVYEIQQSSDTTYRLYDWGRLGLDGQPRELHIDKGLSVANLQSLPQVRRPEGDLLVDGEYFRSWRHTLAEGVLEIATDGRFQALSCIEGSVRVAVAGHAAIALNTGETALVPACFREFSISGSGTLLRSAQR